MAKANKVPISERALMQRLNRKLGKEQLALKKTREDSRAWSNLGDFYVLDIHTNSIADSKLTVVDLERMGREHKVLADFEALVRE